jgi:hypothetical protein
MRLLGHPGKVVPEISTDSKRSVLKGEDNEIVLTVQG